MDAGLVLRASLIACSIQLVGCGGDDSEPTGTGKPGPDDWGTAAMPCNISTGYPGDELCILPPPEGTGFQMHYGPASYDQAEINKFLLMPGDERTDCIFVDTPNQTEMFFNEYHGRMRPGSHHMLLYLADADVPDTNQPGPCNEGLTQRNMFGAQEPVTDFGPKLDGAPENKGLGFRIPPKQQGKLQLHFINTGTEPVLREAWANAIYVDASSVTQIFDPIFFIGGLGMNIQPGQTTILKGETTVPPSAGPDGIRILKATGHYHANTVRFTAHVTIGGQRSVLLEDFDWHDPALVTFDSKTNNPAPDAVAKTAGGMSGIVRLMPGDKVEWECEVVNTQDHALRFGNAVYDAEMCNMFGGYTPTWGTSWYAAF
jgi:hypothetical protein